MIYKIAEFKIKREYLERAKQAIREFVEAVKTEPGTEIYSSYQKEDELSFIHFMAFKDKQAEDFHRQTPHVKKFVSVLYPLCDYEPRFTELRLLWEK